MNCRNIIKLSGIYLLKNLINGKIYIGKANNLQKRIQSHFWKTAKQLIDKEIKLYGSEFFTLEILHYYKSFINNIELLALETAFIEFYDSTNPLLGYNKCKCSNDSFGIKRSEECNRKNREYRIGKPLKEETKIKISESLKGIMSKEKHPNWGKKLPLETINKMSKAHLTNNPWRGCHHTQLAKEKLSKINLGKKWKLESIKKRSKTVNKKIQQINKNTGEIIKIWDSCKEACINLSPSHSLTGAISDALKKYPKSAFGFIWKYN